MTSLVVSGALVTSLVTSLVSPMVSSPVPGVLHLVPGVGVGAGEDWPSSLSL